MKVSTVMREVAAEWFAAAGVVSTIRAEVLTSNSSSLAAQQHKPAGDKWYDKWSPQSANVYVDGKSDRRELTRGSGGGAGGGGGNAPDIDDRASGFGPDDEDTENGSDTRMTTTLVVVIIVVSFREHFSRLSLRIVKHALLGDVQDTVSYSGDEAIGSVDWVVDTVSTLQSSSATSPVSKDIFLTDFTHVPSTEQPPVSPPGWPPESVDSSAIIPLICICILAVIGGAVVGLLAAILLVMFVVYRMRKKDEGSYALDESKCPPSYPYAYQKAPTREFYA
ncbi:unnamed protein product [Soboliphyme baturini]|uniref:Syndecan n=1 Tax=Soboliphyme baturini TaxID=241478 RepID=A0A183IY53_9BILA|nr:unnamed protein product [Soboliphyme baturini]